MSQTCLLVVKEKNKTKKFSGVLKVPAVKVAAPVMRKVLACNNYLFLKAHSLCDASCPYITVLPSDNGNNFAKMIGNCHILQALPADESSESLKVL